MQAKGNDVGGSWNIVSTFVQTFFFYWVYSKKCADTAVIFSFIFMAYTSQNNLKQTKKVLPCTSRQSASFRIPLAALSHPWL